MIADRMAALAAPRPTRRGLILGAAAVGGALVVGFRPSPAAARAGAAPELAGYVRIAKDSRITILAAHLEMGQRINHGIATLVNEELRADWAQIRVEGAAGDPKRFGNLAWGGAIQGTGGSTGLASSFERYRKAGAAAREMLVRAAAEAWGVPAAEIAVERGVIRHGARQATFGDMAERAARLPAPRNPQLRAPADWIYIGKEEGVVGLTGDSRPKTEGDVVYTADVRLPGMLTAVMLHPPLFGATLRSFDAAKARAMPGVVDVVRTPRGLAVVAEGMWAALKAREAVTAEWDLSRAETRSTPEIMAEYRRVAAGRPKAIAAARGDIDAAFRRAAKVLEATFEFPYLAHAALEPINAVARIENGRVEVWGGHQMPDVYQAIAAQTAGVTPDRVTLHVLPTGGGFGRRAVADGDIVVEAVAASRALGGRPVKVQWTREDDMRAGRYRPAYVHRLKAGLDAEGNLIAWEHHIVGQSIAAGTPFAAGMVRNGVDATSVEGATELPYAIPALRVGLTTMESPVPVLWWRAVGSTHTAHAVEAFIDELAEAAGQDPIAFRLKMMKGKPRHEAVLRLAAEKAGWGRPLPPGRFRGVALAESFSSYVAQVAEVSIEGGRPKVWRVVCAVDCGLAVNPDNVRAQMEGGIGFGLGAVMKSEITLDRGRVVQGNFDGYEVLRMDEAPAIEVHIVPSAETPTGVGEPGVPPIGPAAANALYQADRKRRRVLPFSREENRA